MLRFVIFSIFSFCSLIVFGQQQKPSEGPTAKVFYIGENEKEYEKIVKNYSTMLFTVCENQMEKAYDNWSLFLKDVDAYIAKQNYDLKGVKLWLNVFWDKDGTIDYIVFYPKPNSKNVNYDQLKVLLTSFCKNYQSPLKFTSGFSHYGSASFPLFSKPITGSEK